MPKISLHGTGAMFASAVLFSCMAVSVKYVSSRISAPEIIFFRSLISALLIIAMGFAGRVRFKVSSTDKLVFRGIIGGISLMLYFYSLTLTSVSNAVLLAYTYPIFASIFSVIYLKENMTKEKVLFMATAIIGLFTIFGLDVSALNIGDILALVSAVTSGMAIVAIRELRKTDSSAMITFSFVLSGTIFSSFFLKGNFLIPGNYDAFMLLLIGIFGTFGQILMTRGYKRCSAALGGVISMSSIVMTALLGIFIFHDSITPNMIIGGTLIFISASFFSFKEECEEVPQ